MGLIEFENDKEYSACIKVVGVGGGGSNAVNAMVRSHIQGVEFLGYDGCAAGAGAAAHAGGDEDHVRPFQYGADLVFAFFQRQTASGA